MRIEGDSFADIISRVRRADYAARLASMSTLEGKMKERIHQDGQKTDGSQIGTYSTRWANVRASRTTESGTSNALQTAYVDLEFNGDLRASLQTGESEGMPVLGFDSEDQYKKASGLSNGNGKWNGYGEIYTPNDEEIDDLTFAYEEQLRIEFDALRTR